MAKHSSDDSSSEFEWPPREDVLADQVFTIGDRLPPAATPPRKARAAAAPRASESLLDEPQVAAVRTLEERATTSPRTARKSPRRSRGAVTPPKLDGSRMLWSALAVTTLIAVAQAAYILRVRPWQAADAPVTESRAEPQRTDPPADPVGPPSPVERAPSTAGTTGQSTRPSVSKSRLVIRSEPAGARVSIDGRYRGVTPLTLTNVQPGTYQVSLEREGAEVRQTVRVDSGASVSLVAPLHASAGAPTGWLSLDTPIELDVFEDGTLLGTSRSSRILVEAGPHSLQLVNDELDFRENRQVQLEPGSVLRIPVGIPESIVQLNATPWAEVWIDGRHVGQTPIGRLSLPIGTHEVVFRHPELGERRTTAIVKAGTPTRVTADLTQRTPVTRQP